MAEAAKKGADKKSADKDAPEEKKSGKGKLVVIIVALVVVGAGSAGGAVFWMRSHESPKSAAAKEAAKDAAKKAEQPAIFIPLDPPFVVNFQSEQAVRFLQVAVQVMTHDPETAELLKQHDPVIKNDLLLMFGGQKYDVLSTREGKEKLQADALTAIRAIVTKAGGKGDAVEALYFTSFVMQ
jgi:flagellar FliL protein